MREIQIGEGFQIGGEFQIEEGELLQIEGKLQIGEGLQIGGTAEPTERAKYQTILEGELNRKKSWHSLSFGHAGTKFWARKGNLLNY